MKFLDWIRQGAAAQKQAPAAKPEQPQFKQAQAQQSHVDAVEKATRPSVRQLAARENEKLAAIRQKMEKTFEEPSAPKPDPAPADNASNPEALRQNKSGQDLAAPALSPTGSHRGVAPSEKPSSPFQMRDVEGPEKPPPTPNPTIRRRPPSWER